MTIEFGPDITDEQLLAAFSKGERTALGELARRHERGLLGLACGLLHGRRDDAVDAVQETWLRVVRFARNFNGTSSIKTWLYRITINECRTMQMRSAREARRMRADAFNNGVASEGQIPAEPIAIPSDDHRIVREAVARLDIQKRTLVLLCYHAGVTHAQAAEIMGVPVGTLKSRLHATLNQLREMIPQEVRT